MDLIQGQHVLIVGAGGSVRTCRDKILAFIEEHQPKTFGINKMTGLCTPDIHLWTNKQRYRDQGECVDSERSTLLFGCGMPLKLIRKHHDGEFRRVDYEDRVGLELAVQNGKIFGSFRTAGALAVMISHVHGARQIDIVGMDGFTLHPKKSLKSGGADHHCYGSGYTDDATWKQCLHKDKLVDDSLHALADFGVKFRILTPTKFVDFFDGSVLGVELPEG